ncbi:MAG: hypothetical protein RIS85_1419 [Pseudomonadota bacterium]|jgi:aldose 1-epimerase
MITLASDGYELDIVPEQGGGLARLDWNGEALLRTACGPSPLDLASFPLVPFSNRIAHGRFRHGPHDVTLSPNFPSVDATHPLHGFGWITEWQTVETGRDHAVIEHRHQGGEWPWPYLARQTFTLSGQGVHMALSVTNTGDEAMPAGLGFHPYFPRDDRTIYRGSHRGEWQAGPDCLPVMLNDAGAAVDWWQGKPIASRNVDTVYDGRSGPLEILYPDRRLEITISASDNLPCTVVYVPADATFFCAEPVSHTSNAIGHADADHPMATLLPGQTLEVAMTITARRI